MHYIIFYYVIIYYVFSEATTTVLESFTNSIRKHLCWSLFFSLRWFFLERHLFCMNKPYFCQNFLLIDWRHKHLIYCYFTENTSVNFRKVIYENFLKKHFISQQTYLYIQVTYILKFYEVLFCTNCEGLFCL